MAHRPARVTDAELAVLEALWRHWPASVRQLTDAVYPGGGATEYGTVHKLLERLEGKGCVRRERRGREYMIRATVEQRTGIEAALRQWRFKPPTVDGRAIEIETGLLLEFRGGGVAYLTADAR